MRQQIVVPERRLILPPRFMPTHRRRPCIAPGRYRYPFPRRAAIAIVGSPVSSAATNAGSIAATINGVTAGNCLIAVVSIAQILNAAQAVITPTDTNGTWADVGSNALTLDTLNSWYYGTMIATQQNCNSGSHTVTYTFPNGSTYAELTVFEVSGLLTSGAVDKLSHLDQQGSGTHPLTVPNTAVLSQADELVVVGISLLAPTGAANAAISDPPTGYTSLHAQQDTSSTVGAQQSYKIVASTSAVGVSWDWTDTTIEVECGQIVTLKAAAAGGGGTKRFQRIVGHRFALVGQGGLAS